MNDIDLLHRLETDEQRALWGLRAAAQLLQKDAITASEVSDILASHGRLAMSRQKVTSILEAAGAAVRRTKKAGKRHFQLMKSGEESIGDGGPGAVMIDPANGLDAIRNFEDVLSSLQAQVRICDPYVDNKSLDFIARMTAASEIRLLTHNILGERTFRRDLSAVERQLGIPLEVRVTAAAENHDRYILSENHSFLMGTSLNGFAKKRSFVTPISGLRGAVSTAFERDWSRASKFS